MPDGVGSGETAGVWDRKPEPRPAKTPVAAKRVAVKAMAADGGKV